MWFLYLDESGDLGFDFVNKKPSKFFTVTILAVSSNERNRALLKAAKITLRRKLNSRKNRKRIVHELKATKTIFSIKEYLFKKLENIHFGIYGITLNKKKIFEKLTRNKSKVYNWIARQVIEKIPFENNHGETVHLVIDKCMSKPEIVEFNNYIRSQLEARLDPKTPLIITHENSIMNSGIQLADMFSWGIFQKYEKKDLQWYRVFQKKVRFDEQCL